MNCQPPSSSSTINHMLTSAAVATEAMATDGGNKVPLMLKKGAMLSACLVGVWVLVQLMTQFASAVKPLVLATMLAGCLEYFVQLFEVGLVRASRLVHCALCCQCCRGRRRIRPHGGALDADERYLELEASSGAEDGSTSCLPEEVTAEWKLEDAGRFFLPRLVAVVMVLTVAAISIGQLVSSLMANLKNIDLQVYRQGLTELEQAILALAQKVSPDIKDQLQSRLTSLSDRISNTALELTNQVLSSMTNLLVQVTMFLLYALMWLLKPLPAGRAVFLIVRTYFMYKSFCNFVFSLCVWCLLAWIGADLAVVLALVCFFLSFIPEVGGFIALILPVPLLLLDSRHPLSERAANVLTASLGMLAIKFLVSNGLESVVMGKSATLAGAEGCNRATTEETHPVLILFSVIICGEVWGTTGMLISVPLISMVRLVLNLERSLDKRTAEIRRSKTINIPEGDLAASSDVAELEAEQEMLQGCRR
ncbi:unnamed protein product [Polarella glacialis]|uniref:Uncharacterized protein n=1 Tax=Polarella glacialis TaxID=89957 RepID=A0A813GCF0_POLGL|nr:unnamed protein product [Polarella glacialis]CAE8688921.1 unnamed protein product [Polarella glacialis]